MLKILQPIETFSDCKYFDTRDKLATEILACARAWIFERTKAANDAGFPNIRAIVRFRAASTGARGFYAFVESIV